VYFNIFPTRFECAFSGEDNFSKIHSWFTGFEWIFSNCICCGNHIGWAFRKYQTPGGGPPGEGERFSEKIKIKKNLKF
jgi:hypothetical protein